MFVIHTHSLVDGASTLVGVSQSFANAEFFIRGRYPGDGRIVDSIGDTGLMLFNIYEYIPCPNTKHELVPVRKIAQYSVRQTVMI